MNRNRFFKDNKKKIIVGLILWLFITIVLVSPFTYCSAAATLNGPFDFEKFLELTPKAFGHPFKSFTALAEAKMLSKCFVNFLFMTIIYFIFFTAGLFKTKLKSGYEKIEHGSSDWSHSGEQYRVLNDKEGIILAEENYLPVNKVGNVNVLVVGRIWVW